MKKTECKRCGYKWLPRVERPKRCPKCQSYNWYTKKNLKVQTEGERMYISNDDRWGTEQAVFETIEGAALAAAELFDMPYEDALEFVREAREVA